MRVFNKIFGSWGILVPCGLKLQFLEILAPVFGLFTSFILLYYLSSLNRSNIFLALFFCCNLIVLVYYGLHYSKSEFWEGICFVHFLPLSFLLGPSLFYYVKHTVSEDKSFGILDGLHLLPAVFVGIACLPFTTLPLDVKTRMAHEIVNITEDYNLPFQWVSFEQLLYGRSIHVLMYAGLSLGYFFWNKRQLVEKFGTTPTNHRVIQRWFFTLVAFQVIIACTSLGHMVTLYARPFSIFGLSFVEIFSEEHFSGSVVEVFYPKFLFVPISEHFVWQYFLHGGFGPNDYFEKIKIEFDEASESEWIRGGFGGLDWSLFSKKSVYQVEFYLVSNVI